MLFDIPALPVFDASNSAATTSLEPYWGTPYTDSAGTVYDGYSGFTVTDSYSCTSGACGGFSVGSGYGAPTVAGADITPTQTLTDGAQTTSLDPFYGHPYMDSDGNTYDGFNGYTVVDSYSCGEPPCGGFSMGSGYGNPVAGADIASTQNLAGGTQTTSLDPFYGTPYTDSDGTVYDGFNGYTVVDSYSCGEPPCGGFSMGSGYGPSPALAAPVVAATPASGQPQRAVRASASQLLLCGHAMLLGALSATGAAADGLAKGKTVSGEDWAAEFKRSAAAAAQSVSPASAALLSKQVFAQ